MFMICSNKIEIAIFVFLLQKNQWFHSDIESESKTELDDDEESELISGQASAQIGSIQLEPLQSAPRQHPRDPEILSFHA